MGARLVSCPIPGRFVSDNVAAISMEVLLWHTEHNVWPGSFLQLASEAVLIFRLISPKKKSTTVFLLEQNFLLPMGALLMKPSERRGTVRFVISTKQASARQSISTFGRRQ